MLVVNPGSSSLKLRMLEQDDRVAAEEELPASNGEVDFLSSMSAPSSVSPSPT